MDIRPTSSNEEKYGDIAAVSSSIWDTADSILHYGLIRSGQKKEETKPSETFEDPEESPARSHGVFALYTKRNMCKVPFANVTGIAYDM